MPYELIVSIVVAVVVLLYVAFQGFVRSNEPLFVLLGNDLDDNVFRLVFTKGSKWKDGFYLNYYLIANHRNRREAFENLLVQLAQSDAVNVIVHLTSEPKSNSAFHGLEPLRKIMEMNEDIEFRQKRTDAIGAVEQILSM